MAKVPFSKLQASVNSGNEIRFYRNKTGEQINYEVKTYLPFKDKLDLVSRIINYSLDDNGFYNPMRVQMFMTLEIVFTYTNLSFTDKQKEDLFKLYDILVSTGIFADVLDAIPNSEYEKVYEGVWTTIDSIYAYKNSVMGILDNVVNDYSNLELDAANLQKSIADPENLELLRAVLAKLG